MTADLPEATDESIMQWVFGDEVSSKRMHDAMVSSASDTYISVLMGPVNGPLWERRVLPVKTTVLMNLAILAVLNRPHELYTRVVGLLRGGITAQEIKEVFLHIGFYAGNPAGVEATVTLHEAMTYLNERGIPFKES